MDREEILTLLKQNFTLLEQEFVKPYPRAVEALRRNKLPERVHAVFFFGRSFGDDGDELFALAARLVVMRQANQVLINGSEGERFGGTKPGEAWAGKTAWTERLHSFWSPELFREPLTSRPAFHAKDEHEAFLDVAVERGWKSAALLTNPHQSLRFMLGQLKSCDDRNYPMRLYAIVPKRTDWEKPVYGSQGAEQLPRWAHVGLEASRIAWYQIKGDLAMYPRFFEYMEQRSSLG